MTTSRAVEARVTLAVWFALVGVFPAPGSGKDEKSASKQQATRRDAAGDPLPPGALLRIGTTRLRHQSDVNGVAFSPDGKLVASACGDDCSVRVWRVSTGKEVHRLSADKPLKGVVFSPDGGSVLSSFHTTHTKKFRVWDTRSGKVLCDLGGFGEEVHAFALSPDGKILAEAERETILLWDLAKRVTIRKFNAGDRWVTALAFSPDGRTLACGGPPDNRALQRFWVGVYETSSGKAVWQAPGPKDHLSAVAFSPDGKTLVVASAPEPVLVYEAATGRKRGTIGTAVCACLAFSPDGSILATGGNAGRLHLWDFLSGKLLRQLRGHGSTVTSLAFSRDGQTLVSGAFEGSVRLWEVKTGKEVHPPRGHQYRLFSVAYLPKGKTLVSHASDHTARLWDTSTGKELRRLTLLPLSRLGFERDFVYGDQNGLLLPHSLAVSPDGKTVAVCDPYRHIHLWEMASGKDRVLFKGHEHYVTCGVFAPEGKAFLSGGESGTVRIWNSVTGQLQKELPVSKPDEVRGLALAPDGQRLITCDIWGTIRLTDLTSGKQRVLWRPKQQERVALAHKQQERVALALAPDGSTLLTAREIKYGAALITLWDMTAEAVRCQLKGPPGNVNAVAFSADGRLVAAAGDKDRTVWVWEATTGQDVLRFEGHQQAVTSIAFAPDNRSVASGSKDTTILIWDLLAPGLQARRPPVRNFASLWEDLASEDARRAYRANCLLVLHPEEALPLLSKHLRPIPQDKTRKTIQQLLEDLGRRQARIRDAAFRELKGRGWEAQPAVRQALANATDLDLRRRLENLLAEWERSRNDPENLRQQRAIQVLERIGLGQARQVLQALAGGQSGAHLTEAARAALTRLRRD